MYTVPLFVVYLAFVAAMMSPGPDFLMVLRNSLGHSMRKGVMTAGGITAGNVIHMSYCLAGIGLLISKSLLLFSLIKTIGALYLLYIGAKALRSKGMQPDALNANAAPAPKTDYKAFANGFITNVFNPKCTLFFLALFTQMVSPSLPFSVQLAFCAICLLTVMIWFSLVATVMGVPKVRAAYVRASKAIDRIFGTFFIALGAKIAFSHR